MSETPEVENLRERARLLDELGRHKEAIPLLHQALALSPADADLLCRLSGAHYRLQEWKQALKFAEEAIAAEPQESWAHALRSNIMVVRNQGREAVKSGEEALRLAPHHADYLQTLFHAYVSCHRWKDAEKTALRYREVRPDLADPYELLATVAQAKRRTSEAEAYLRQARTLDPTSPEIAHRLAVLESRGKGAPERFQRLYEAVRLDPMNAQAQESLSATGFSFSGPPLLILATISAIAVVLLGPILRVNATATYLMVFGLLTLPPFPIHRLHPEWLLAWQPGVRSLPPEMQENLMRMWRRHWLPYSIGFFVLTLIGALVLAGVLVAIVLAVHALRA